MNPLGQQHDPDFISGSCLGLERPSEVQEDDERGQAADLSPSLLDDQPRHARSSGSRTTKEFPVSG